MSEKAYRTGKCPKCLEELTVPEELAFSGVPGEELASSDTAYAAFRSSIHAEFTADHTGVTLASWGSDPVFYSFRD